MTQGIACDSCGEWIGDKPTRIRVTDGDEEWDFCDRECLDRGTPSAEDGDDGE